MTKAIEAAARAVCAARQSTWREGQIAMGGSIIDTDKWNNGHRHIAQAAVTAYLAAMEAGGFVMARVEPVHGANIDEWRTNISLDLYRSGDLVLAWVNQGDINAALLSATQHDDGGE
jgi:hypothetical protein